MKFTELTPGRSPFSSSLSSYWPFITSFDADQFESDMNEFMRDLDSETDYTQDLDYGGRIFPTLDVKETPESYSVEAELPGLTAKDVEIEVVNNALFIKGETAKEGEVGNGYICCERTHGPFSRKISFMKEVNLNNIDAELKNGVLHVELKKKDVELAKHKTIEIHQ
ncbi:MAG: Hsp20/alpha crystallin family protein [Bdellovibrionota bacterium]